MSDAKTETLKFEPPDNDPSLYIHPEDKRLAGTQQERDNARKALELFLNTPMRPGEYERKIDLTNDSSPMYEMCILELAHKKGIHALSYVLMTRQLGGTLRETWIQGPTEDTFIVNHSIRPNDRVDKWLPQETVSHQLVRLSKAGQSDLAKRFVFEEKKLGNIRPDYPGQYNPHHPQPEI